EGDRSRRRGCGGRGLGLTICQRLITLMGGTMGLASTPGVGSTFWLELPLARQEGAATPGPEAPGDLVGLRVLVVDDNATNRRILHEQLRSWGWQPVAGAGGAQALQALHGACPDERFALVILDLQMPGMDGEETAAAIKSDPAFADIPLVLLSSLGSRGTTAELAAKGIAATLTKPVRAMHLFYTLLRVLGAVRGAPAASAPASVPAPLRSTGLRVLVVEDNPVNQAVAVRLLARRGHHTDVA